MFVLGSVNFQSSYLYTYIGDFKRPTSPQKTWLVLNSWGPWYVYCCRLGIDIIYPSGLVPDFMRILRDPTTSSRNPPPPYLRANGSEAFMVEGWHFGEVGGPLKNLPWIMLAVTQPSKRTMAKMVTFFIKIYLPIEDWYFPLPAMLGCRSVLPVASHELTFTPCSLLADGQTPWIWNSVVKLSKPIWSIVNSYPPIECWKHNHQLPKHWGADCLWGGEQRFFVIKKSPTCDERHIFEVWVALVSFIHESLSSSNPKLPEE